MNNLLKFLLLCSLMITSLFSYEIKFSKDFSKSIKQDLLVANVSIQVKKEDEVYVNGAVSKFAEYITSFSGDIEKNNSKYSVYPRYAYVNGEAILKSYNGNLEYEFRSKDEESLNELLKQIILLKDGQDEVITVRSLSWKIDEKELDSIFDELRIDAISWIKDYQKVLSKKINSTCKINDISFNTNYNRYSPRVQMNAVSNNKASFANMPKLEQTNKNVNYNVNYILECR